MMEKDKIKKYTVRFGIVFLGIIALLTYFSKSIDNMLLPKVKLAEIEEGSLSEERFSETRYLVPLSAVIDDGTTGTIFIIKNDDENEDTVVKSVMVNIKNRDEIYYEISTIDGFTNLSRNMIVYSTSKSISDGDRVYVEKK